MRYLTIIQGQWSETDGCNRFRLRVVDAEDANTAARQSQFGTSAMPVATIPVAAVVAALEGAVIEVLQK